MSRCRAPVGSVRRQNPALSGRRSRLLEPRRGPVRRLAAGAAAPRSAATSGRPDLHDGAPTPGWPTATRPFGHADVRPGSRSEDIAERTAGALAGNEKEDTALTMAASPDRRHFAGPRRGVLGAPARKAGALNYPGLWGAPGSCGAAGPGLGRPLGGVREEWSVLFGCRESRRGGFCRRFRVPVAAGRVSRPAAVV